ncbi:3-oxoacyl-ACP reductase [Sphaerimonospora thailandensis]|uniref:3-oxoacyl-ACP reductase n=1 Tax=Sphaerimonospora thailandensis TaxID=795644 RepID=A0A8J3W244_9ACTN|nr:3-oxoacyl-ACP reductase [Sphaerimonospora thailandensis]
MAEAQRAVAVVTGSGQGLGRAFAQRLAADGFRIVVADVQADAAAAVADELCRLHGTGAAVAAPVDVSDEDSVGALAEQVQRDAGRWDVLVNNAAVFSSLSMKPFGEIPVAEWDMVMAVNVRGAFLCCRAAVPAMRKLGRGKIVNVASAAVFQGRPNYLHYVSSKAALIGLTGALASEVGNDGITVNAVAPGSTETEVPRSTVTPDQVQQIIARQAIHRRQVSDDVVGAVSFLVSADSDFITGQTLTVDGGSVFR